MAKIGEMTQSKITHMVAALMRDHAEELDEAYLRADDQLSVSFPVKVKPGPRGNEIKVGISFVQSRCKDEIEDAVDENQTVMFEGDAA